MSCMAGLHRKVKLRGSGHQLAGVANGFAIVRDMQALLLSAQSL